MGAASAQGRVQPARMQPRKQCFELVQDRNENVLSGNVKSKSGNLLN